MAPIRTNASIKWCFTFNNYPSDWLFYMAPWLRDHASGWIIGEEVGGEGTPHLQGYIEFKKKTRPIECMSNHGRQLPRYDTIHWEKAKGTKAQNIAYCSKEGKITSNFKVEQPLIIKPLYGWQEKALAITQQPVDPRRVHWLWEPEGAYGKTSFIRYMVHHHQALICTGKSSDAKYLIVKYKEANGMFPDIILWNISRTMEKFISYQAIEEIKDGVFASTKYECSTVLMNPPHLLIFANFGPDLVDPGLSLDRFYIRNLRTEELD